MFWDTTFRIFAYICGEQQPYIINRLKFQGGRNYETKTKDAQPGRIRTGQHLQR